MTAPDSPAVVTAPPAGLRRAARGDNPLSVPAEPQPVNPSAGNRFDALTMTYGVLYFGTNLEACFGGTLARLQPSLELLALVKDEWEQFGFMATGTIAADWRQRRTAVHDRVPSDLKFVDVESSLTHQALRKEVALGLSSIGLMDLDVSTVPRP